MGIKRKRRLMENAVPTIFSFTSEKKRRESSMNRADASAKKLFVQEAMFDLPGSSHDEEQMCSLLPVKQPSYDLARKNLFRNFTLHTDYFKNSFPYCVREWNKINPNLRNSPSLSVFKKGLLAFIRPKECSIYNIIDPYGLKLLTRLRVNLSHLREHKFRHNFLNTLNPLCSCMLETESTDHYLLRCPFYADVRKTLFDNINKKPLGLEKFLFFVFSQESVCRIIEELHQCNSDFMK